VPDGDYVVPLGVANVTRPGKDLTVVSYSRTANVALKAAETCAKDGIDAEVIDLRCLRPMDMDTVLASVKKTGRLLLASEACKEGNAVTEIAMRVVEHGFDYLDAPIVRVCGANVPIPMSPALEDAVVPNEKRLVAEITKLAKK
jgi:pyruvate/2-oxoglutarate/acetoin dehydrogenase E1 component